MGNNIIIECSNDRHKRRDNKFGVTWCVKCGKLFSKPSGIELKQSEIIVYNKINEA